jgi:hypothetical protein
MNRFMVTLTADDLAGLDALVRLDGANAGDAGAIKHLAATTMREGIAARLQQAHLPWAPTEAVASERVEQLAAEASRPAAPPTLWTTVRTDRRIALAAWSGLAIFVLISLLGGYIGDWAWTGFADNGQLWDWLHLVLLPVAFGTVPLWLRYAEHMSQARKLVFAGLLLAFVVFVIVGYAVPIGWTGFSGNTLWDWLTLIVLPVTIIAFRAWPASRREIRPLHIRVFTVFGVAWVVTLIGGYAATWHWTGYPGNTLWDWLKLLLAPIILTTVLIPRTVKWVSGNAADRAAAAEKAKEVVVPQTAPAR